MPSLAVMLEATPACGRWRMFRRGQHGLHFHCPRLMRWRGERWRCPDCDL
jgi:hypothetical protein